jgi:hypothetical protein
MSERDELGRYTDDEEAARSRYERAQRNHWCGVCNTRGGHASGCPETPEPPEYEDMTDDQKVESLCEDLTAAEIAERLVELQNRVAAHALVPRIPTRAMLNAWNRSMQENATLPVTWDRLLVACGARTEHPLDRAKRLAWEAINRELL